MKFVPSKKHGHLDFNRPYTCAGLYGMPKGRDLLFLGHLFPFEIASVDQISWIRKQPLMRRVYLIHSELLLCVRKDEENIIGRSSYMSD